MATEKKKKFSRARERSLPVPVQLSDDWGRWSGRLEESIGRLAQATTDLSVGVAAHKERLDNMEQQAKTSNDAFAKLSDDRIADYRVLDSRISTVHQELIGKIDSQTTAIMSKVEESQRAITDKIDVDKKETVSRMVKIGRRVGKLEVWRTLIAGGAIVVGILFSVFLVKLAANVVPWLAWLK
jgi:preprotein translocase subunit SecF